MWRESGRAGREGRKEVGRVRGREGEREGKPITYGGRDEVKGRNEGDIESGREGRG